MRAFLRELKRRRVARVTAVYAAAAFIVWQAADIVFPALHLPPWLVTAVVAHDRRLLHGARAGKGFRHHAGRCLGHAVGCQ
jgi:hypothetical protein